MLVTRMPRDSRIAAREAAAMPFPRLETTPPVTNTYLVISPKRNVKAGVYSIRSAPTNDSGLRELLAAAELRQRLGIGERLEVLRLPAVHDVAYRELDDLAALGARDVGHLQHLGRHVPGGGIGPNSRFYFIYKNLIQI